MFEFGLHFALAAEEREGLTGCHLQHLGDAAAAIFYVQHRLPIPPPVALGAAHVYVSHELHIDRQKTIAVTSFAPAAFHVKAEVASREAACPRVDLFGEQRANWIEGLDIRG